MAILDVRLEDGSGIEVCRDVRSAVPGLACLMLTSFADDEALYASVMAGAAGFVLKQIKARDLIEDVKKVATGASLMDPRAVARVVERIANPPAGDPALDSLSPQERRVLDLIAEGKTNKQIAETMFLAEHTVKNYITGLLAQAQDDESHRGGDLRHQTEDGGSAAPRVARTVVPRDGFRSADRCSASPDSTRPGTAIPVITRDARHDQVDVRRGPRGSLRRRMRATWG